MDSDRNLPWHILQIHLLVALAASCGGPQDGGTDEPVAVTSVPDPPAEPVASPTTPPEIMKETLGMDASCSEDEDCIATYDSGNCGCCNCDHILITSRKTYEWLMGEYAKEQCDDSWCATVDCEACPPPPALGPAICHEGACGMVVPEGS